MKQNIIKDFLNHLFPKVILEKNLKLSYTFCFGGLCLVSFFLLIITGILLMFYYRPDPEHAYNSLVIIDSSVFGGKFIRTLHKTSSDVFLALLFLHVLRVILTGSFRRPRHVNWLIGMCLFLFSICEAFSGYMLPMEQAGFWAINTSINIIELFPFGTLLKDLLVPDSLEGPYTLLRFYTLHIIVLPFLILIFVFLHFYLIRKSKGILPYL